MFFFTVSLVAALVASVGADESAFEKRAAGQCGKVQREPVKLTSSGVIDGSGIKHNQHGIINGEEAAANSIPWQAKLFQRSNSGQFCGGSLLNDKWVVTAAHCIIFPKNEIMVELGAKTRFVSPETKNTYCSVQQVIVHEQYNKVYKFSRDIALLRLGGCNKRLAFGGSIAPICLPPSNANFGNANIYGMVSGWGRNKGGNSQSTGQTLQRVVLKMHSNTECRAKWPVYDDGVLCASAMKAGKQHSACQGDSGGPLAVRGNHGRWVLAGVVSFGSTSCLEVGQPNVYSHVPFYLSWLNRNMR